MKRRKKKEHLTKTKEGKDEARHIPKSISCQPRRVRRDGGFSSGMWLEKKKKEVVQKGGTQVLSWEQDCFKNRRD